MYEFLAQLLASRQQQLEVVSREARLVRHDMEAVAAVLRDLQAGAAELAPAPAPGVTGGGGEAVRALRQEVAELAGSVSDTAGGSVLSAGEPPHEEESFAGGAGAGAGGAASGGDALAARWRRLTAHFDDFVQVTSLEQSLSLSSMRVTGLHDCVPRVVSCRVVFQCYFAHRAEELYFPSPAEAPSLTSLHTAVTSLPGGGSGGVAGAIPVSAGALGAAVSPPQEDHVPQAPDSQPQNTGIILHSVITCL